MDFTRSLDTALGLSEGGRYDHRVMEPKGKFDKRSFRTIDSGEKGDTKVVVGCPKGQWDNKRRRCKVGTRGHKLLTPKKSAD